MTINHHPYWWAQTGNEWQAAIVKQAGKLGAPIWSATSWLNFNDARRQIRSSASDERITVDIPQGGSAIVVERDENCSDIRVNGRRVQATDWQPLRTAWCIISLPAGRHTITSSN